MRHHLAILYPQYVDAILDGRKTVECRLGKMGRPPHGLVGPGDFLWLKETSGPVRGVASAEAVHSHSNLTPARIEELRHEFGREVAAPPEFWTTFADATAATLIRLTLVCPLRPFTIAKRNRRAWMVLSGPPVPVAPIDVAQQGDPLTVRG